MLKKLTLLAMSVAALVALAAPAGAQATPLVHNAFGEEVNTLTAVSGNTVSKTSGGVELACTTVDLGITLSENTTTTAKGTFGGYASGTPGKTHTGHCASSLGLAVDITSVSGSVDLKANGTGTATFNYKFTITGAGNCEFDGHANVSYIPGTDVISLNGTLTTPTAKFPCSTEGTISGLFTVTAKPSGEEVTIG